MTGTWFSLLDQRGGFEFEAPVTELLPSEVCGLQPGHRIPGHSIAAARLGGIGAGTIAESAALCCSRLTRRAVYVRSTQTTQARPWRPSTSPLIRP